MAAQQRERMQAWAYPLASLFHSCTVSAQYLGQLPVESKLCFLVQELTLSFEAYAGAPVYVTCEQIRLTSQGKRMHGIVREKVP